MVQENKSDMMMHKGTKTLQSKRLILRKYVYFDAEDMFRNYGADKRVTRFLNWEPYEDIASIKPFLDFCMEEYEKEDVYHWAVEFGGEMIGSISVMQIDEINCSCEVGYCIGFNFWNKGIMSEALQTVMGFLFSEVNVRRIIAKHDADNPASGKVMQKCGMIYEGRLREHYLYPDGSASDSLVYGILKKEFSV